MFNLEQSITEWRQQMLAAGIQSPEPLGELEGHLRDEIVRQVQAGATESHAFALAGAQIGRADALKSEFKKTASPLGWLGVTPEIRVRRALGLLWFILCSIQLVSGAIVIGAIYRYHGQSFGISTRVFGILVTQPDVILALWFFYGLLHGCGLVASIRLFLARGGRQTILLLALFSLVMCASQLNIIIHTSSPVAIVWTALYPITIFALWPRQKTKIAME